MEEQHRHNTTDSRPLNGSQWFLLHNRVETEGSTRGTMKLKISIFKNASGDVWVSVIPSSWRTKMLTMNPQSSWISGSWEQEVMSEADRKPQRLLLFHVLEHVPKGPSGAAPLMWLSRRREEASAGVAAHDVKTVDSSTAPPSGLKPEEEPLRTAETDWTDPGPRCPSLEEDVVSLRPLSVMWPHYVCGPSPLVAIKDTLKSTSGIKLTTFQPWLQYMSYGICCRG